MGLAEFFDRLGSGLQTTGNTLLDYQLKKKQLEAQMQPDPLDELRAKYIQSQTDINNARLTGSVPGIKGVGGSSRGGGSGGSGGGGKTTPEKLAWALTQSDLGTGKIKKEDLPLEYNKNLYKLIKFNEAPEDMSYTNLLNQTSPLPINQVSPTAMPTAQPLPFQPQQIQVPEYEFDPATGQIKRIK